MIETLADGVYGIESSLRTGLGVTLPLRTTLLRLSDGGLLMHSPVRLSDADAQAIDALGPVRHIVAPNAFHHLYAGDAQRRWPGAALSKSPALVKKRPDLQAAHVLGDGPPPWRTEDVDLCEIDGAPMAREFVFFHRPSGALLVTDSAFNIQHPASTFSALWFRLTGAHKAFVQSRIFALVIKDKAAAARSGRRVLDWDVRLVVPCHGEVVRDDARAALGRAWGKMLGDPR